MGRKMYWAKNTQFMGHKERQLSNCAEISPSWVKGSSVKGEIMTTNSGAPDPRNAPQDTQEKRKIEQED